MMFTIVTPQELQARPPMRATRAELRLAADAGRETFANDAARAPGLSPTIRLLVDEHAVGEPRTIELFEAFLGAYEAEVDAAIQKEIR